MNTSPPLKAAAQLFGKVCALFPIVFFALASVQAEVPLGLMSPQEKRLEAVKKNERIDYEMTCQVDVSVATKKVTSLVKCHYKIVWDAASPSKNVLLVTPSELSIEGDGSALSSKTPHPFQLTVTTESVGWRAPTSAEDRLNDYFVSMLFVYILDVREHSDKRTGKRTQLLKPISYGAFVEYWRARLVSVTDQTVGLELLRKDPNLQNVKKPTSAFGRPELFPDMELEGEFEPYFGEITFDAKTLLLKNGTLSQVVEDAGASHANTKVEIRLRLLTELKDDSVK